MNKIKLSIILSILLYGIIHPSVSVFQLIPGINSRTIFNTKMENIYIDVPIYHVILVNCEIRNVIFQGQRVEPCFVELKRNSILLGQIINGFLLQEGKVIDEDSTAVLGRLVNRGYTRSRHDTYS
ncbi:MAG TPA: hypothetical protein VLG50_02670 [Candidatus Saccharimonadales bacterium]|nr:hypothetical protein [Candidatus Saccharimonadales bacterium]